MQCPRCDALLVDNTCPRCRGRFATRAEVAGIVDVDVDALVAHAAHAAHAAQAASSGVSCPACVQVTRHVAHRGWLLDVCPGCGGVWLDGGECLERHGLSAPVSVSAFYRPPGDAETVDLSLLLDGWRLLEEIAVPNDKPVRVSTSTRTIHGTRYLLEASGTVSNWSRTFDNRFMKPGGLAPGIDVIYCYAEWRVGPVPQPWLQLRVDDKSLFDLAGRAIPYDTGHVYRVEIDGTGAPLQMHMSDAQQSWQDNSGSIRVRLFAHHGREAPARS